MKRYLVFGGSRYYPCGGMDDFIEHFGDEAIAVAFARGWKRRDEMDWIHVYDQESRTKVYEDND